MTQYRTVSFLTDYGLADDSVGVVKSVIRTIAPEATVIDITHDIPSFDVRTGSVVLARTANYLAPGVVLAVVDPGVGTSRKAIAVEVGDGESVLVGPDNGLLAPTVAIVGGATRVVELTNEKYQLDAPGHTFAGRDVFGPAVAHLCSGVPITELGPVIDSDSLVPATLPFSEVKDGVLHCDVIYADHYGNLHLNIAPEQLDSYGGSITVRAGDRTEVVKRAVTFDSVSQGNAALVVDDVGLIALVLNQASAADYFGVGIGCAVMIGGSGG